ncbi:phytanoyl-CoA dioxygenase family protein [Phenylobacterium sp.]|uniref:phytanoyl-CoA dioxygenase family protein n=1 Tax=Phenylobacterium sp. TaxID=1871053 RepID=UPI0025E844AD|nr:phytanoyl-CoA dioxygenase family protein [Phenylobacterium sp.]MBX3484129.1 phytanoyl-CoA dioxygenase family protein [Phenylobacterium sp.]
MEIGKWSATPDLNDIYRDIRELGLESNLAELEAFGFTVVEDALSDEQVQHFRGRILEIAEERKGSKLDLENETEHVETEFIPFLLYKDKRFKESVTNPKTLALITYLLGKHCILSSLGCHLKGPGGKGLLLHSDTSNGIPDPFSPYSHVANCNYALTDYTEANGALAMVPGSHRHFRQPTQYERGLDGNERYEHVIPVEVKAGSAVIWHGNTWHGSFPRKNPGLRINLSNYFCREYIQPQENYRYTVPEGFLEPGQDDRLARLLGADLAYGWTDEGPLKYFKRREQAAAGIPSWQY